MAEADVRLTTVQTNGAKLGDVIPAGSVSKAEGKDAISGKWQITGAGQVNLNISGSSVKSVETPFGNQPFMAEIEESEEMFGLHVTLGGFPMKAWLEKDGSSYTMVF